MKNVRTPQGGDFFYSHCILSCSVKEEEHCSGSVVAHTNNFHDVRRCVEAGPNPPHICEPWHQINGAYCRICRDVRPAETGDTAVQLLATSSFFRQDSAPRDGPVFNLWSPNSSDVCWVLTMWGTMRDRVYRAKVQGVDDLHYVSQKTCDYIFYNNFNKRCPITIIFGIVSSKSMRHRKMVSFPTSPI